MTNRKTAKKTVADQQPEVKKAEEAVEAVKESVGEKVKDSVTQLTQRLGGLGEVGKETISVFKESGSAAATGVADLGKETRSYAQGYWDDLSGTAKSVLEAKSLEQVAEIESRYVTGRIEEVAGHVKAVADITARASLAAFTPWADVLSQLAVRADKARYARD